MFCRSKLLICFHAVAFFSIRVISAMYTNHIDARSINVNSDIGKKFYMTLLFMILIMIVNIWELLKNWIDSRKKEFYIRRIVGADKKQIMILFLLDYIGIMIISAILRKTESQKSLKISNTLLPPYNHTSHQHRNQARFLINLLHLRIQEKNIFRLHMSRNIFWIIII